MFIWDEALGLVGGGAIVGEAAGATVLHGWARPYAPAGKTASRDLQYELIEITSEIIEVGAKLSVWRQLESK